MDNTQPSSQLQETIDKYMPYIAEIQKRLLFIVAIFIIGTTIGFIYYDKIVALMLSIFHLKGINIVFTSPFQFINLAMSSGFLVGVLAVSPFLIFQIISFLKPALKKQEYKIVVGLLPLSIILFIFGFAFGVLIMRYVIELFYEKSVALNIGNLLDISQLLSQILVTATLMGLAFQFPIVITLLMRFKVIKYKVFVKQRPVAYIISIIFAALLPPTDILSMVILTLPLIILFELTLILNRVLLKSHLL